MRKRHLRGADSHASSQQQPSVTQQVGDGRPWPPGRRSTWDPKCLLSPRSLHPARCPGSFASSVNTAMGAFWRGISSRLLLSLPSLMRRNLRLACTKKYGTRRPDLATNLPLFQKRQQGLKEKSSGVGIGLSPNSAA